ncbi:unnamed protein product [Brassicogethes aeneus]|uniref:Uncharacterized protein n=1 Tax=Brassicogethes aeneus TaxID=1431903 RepID=A0A9P0F8S9_BRAAE|nr:unnamed protein product [Brassicogethes aeneus]
MLSYIFVVIFSGLILLTDGYKMIPTKISSCPVKGKAFPIECKLLKNEKGENEFFMTTDLPFDINEEFTFTLKISTWAVTTWIPFNQEIQGKLFENIDKIIPKLWEKLRGQVKPAVSDAHLIKADKYILENFQCSMDDILNPIQLRGKFMATLKMFNPQDQEVLCQSLEMFGQD